MTIIKRIVKIKYCPSFIDFKPASDLPNFERFNLIYGWNGSGKTCFSRILRSFENCENYYDNSDRQPEFEFKLDNDVSITHKDLSAFNNIRVFNKDFVDVTVFGIGGPKPIFFLGKENKEGKNRIDTIEKELAKLRPILIKKSFELEKLKSKKDKSLQDTARKIKTALTTSLKDNYRNYDRLNLENALLNKTDLLNNYTKFLLTDEQQIKLNKSIQQNSEEKIDTIKFPNLNLASLEKEVESILLTTITSHAIEALKQDQMINKWVEDGLQIHKNKSLTVCAFCNQKIPEERIRALENHFSDEYNKIIEAVKKLKLKVESRKLQYELPASSDFYDELSRDYSNAKVQTEKDIETYNQRLNEILSVLEEKKQNPFSRLTLSESNPISSDSINKIIEIIGKHNQKTDDFESKIKADKKQLMLHYIAEYLPIYKEFVNDIKDIEEEVGKLSTSIREEEEEVKSSREKLVTHHIPAKNINDDLESFLGRKDIKLQATESKEGYKITRNGDTATNLSEGEKTALSIVYFLTKINEADFDLKKGIIVIDDPVSSLDSNSIFQAFSFIKESIKEVGQIFILTHHFDFFRQVKNWFTYHKKDSQYFMIVCNSEQMGRKSSIIQIDKLLINIGISFCDHDD